MLSASLGLMVAYCALGGPPLPRQGARRRRDMRHVDQARVELCRVSIGGASWFPFAGIFGNPHAVLHYMPCHTAHIIKFPVKAGMK